MKTTTLRASAAFAAAGIMLGMLAGCSPADPEPTPTKTELFASEEEAFAAAEETYRAYADAVNSTKLDDPETFESVFALLTGTALASERESFSLYHAENLTRVGTTAFDSLTPLESDGSQVVVNLCIDVTDVDLLYSDGTSALPPDRVDRSGRKVTFVPGDTATGLKISSNHDPGDDFAC